MVLTPSFMEYQMTHKHFILVSLLILSGSLSHAASSVLSPVGNWVIESQTCDNVQVASSLEAISIGNNGSAVAFRMREETGTELCVALDGYLFQLQGTGSSNSEQIQNGSFKPYKKIVKCFHKKDGQVENTPYLNEAKPLEGETVEGVFSQSNNNALSLKMQNASFCHGTDVEFKLRRY